MNNADSRRTIINLAVGLLFGYSIGFLLVVLGKSTVLYYAGGMLLLFSIILSIMFILSLFALYWDLKKASGSGPMGHIIHRYDEAVTKLASTGKEPEIDIEYEED